MEVTFISALIKAFVILFVIIDPTGGIPVFIMLTKKFTKKELRRAANRSIIVAGSLMILFVLLGISILNFFSISLSSFQIAGGLILMALGVIYVMDIHINNEKKDYGKDITIPVATPLIAGPGVLTAIIIITSTYNIIVGLIVTLLNLLLFWVLMIYSDKILKIIGQQGVEILSRIMGLILTAMAVEFIITGLKAAI